MIKVSGLYFKRDVFILVGLLFHCGCINSAQGLFTIKSQECEVSDNGQVTYYACVADTEKLLFDDNAHATLNVVPQENTCGASREKTCPMDGGACYFCDQSSPSESHPPSNMIDFTRDATGTFTMPDKNSFWQSITWHKVYNSPLVVEISLAFDHLYDLQNTLIFEFVSSRPRSAVLEKSRDFGTTWQAWQVYHTNCSNHPSKENITEENPDTVICTDEYSDIQHNSGGKLEFDIINDRYSIFAGPENDNFRLLSAALDGDKLSTFLSFTTIRLRLLEPARSFNGSPTEEDLFKSYYAVSDINIEADCSCNLHGSVCEFDTTIQETVCVCRHNTIGKNCEICLPMFNNRPWRAGSYLPYPEGAANECQRCQCHGHASSCTYDPTLGYGRCELCQHNTTGARCEKCLPGYFRNVNLSLDHVDTCTECHCEPLGVEEGNMACRDPTGECACKPLVVGRHCDSCKDMYYGLLDVEPRGTCKACGCDSDGTVQGNRDCEKKHGQCDCKPSICGRKCDQCCDGYYLFPSGTPVQDCLPCDCDKSASISGICDKISGQCICKGNFSGLRCTMPMADHFIPSMDRVELQPVESGCNLDTELLSPAFPFTGRFYALCQQEDILLFEEIPGMSLFQPLNKWNYIAVIRYNLENDPDGMKATLSLKTSGPDAEVLSGRSERDLNQTPACPYLHNELLYQYEVTNLEKGFGEAWVAEELLELDKRCNYTASLTLGRSELNQSQAIVIDSFVLMPDFNSSIVYNESGVWIKYSIFCTDPEEKQKYEACVQKLAELKTRPSALKNTTCVSFFSRLMAEITNQALDCDCHPDGAIPDTNCDQHGGQCQCKPGAYGRRCDTCEPGFYNFSKNGCQLCPYLPCPGDGEENTEKDGDSDGDSTAPIGLIILIIILVILIALLVLFLSRRKYRDRIFRKRSISDNISYVNVDARTDEHYGPDKHRRIDIGPEGLEDEEHLDFSLQRSSDEVQRSDSIKSDQPIIYKGRGLVKSIQKENNKLQKRSDSKTVNAVVFDNKAFESDNLSDKNKGAHKTENVENMKRTRNKEKAESERYNQELAQRLSTNDYTGNTDDETLLLGDTTSHKSRRRSNDSKPIEVKPLNPPDGRNDGLVSLKTPLAANSLTEENSLLATDASKVAASAAKYDSNSLILESGKGHQKEKKTIRRLPTPIRSITEESEKKTFNNASKSQNALQTSSEKVSSSPQRAPLSSNLPNGGERTSSSGKELPEPKEFVNNSMPAGSDWDRSFDNTSLSEPIGFEQKRNTGQKAILHSSPVKITADKSQPSSDQKNQRRAPSPGRRTLPQPSSEKLSQEKSPSPGVSTLPKPGTDHQGRGRVPSPGGRTLPQPSNEQQGKGRVPSPGGRTLPQPNTDQQTRGRAASPGGRTLPQPNTDQQSRGRAASPGGRTLPQPNTDQQSRGRAASPGGRTLPQPNTDQQSRGRAASPGGRTLPQPNTDQQSRGRASSPGGRTLPQPNTDQQSRGRAASPGGRTLPQPNTDQQSRGRAASPGGRTLPQHDTDQQSRGRAASPGGRTLPQPGTDQKSRGRAASPGGRTLPQPDTDQQSRGRTASPGGRTLPQPDTDQQSRGRAASPGGRTLPQPGTDLQSRGRAASPGGRTLPQPGTDQQSRGRAASPGGRTLPQPGTDQQSRGRASSPGGRTLPQPGTDQQSRGRAASPGGRTLPQPGTDQHSRGRAESPGGRSLPQPSSNIQSRGRASSPGGRALPQPSSEQKGQGNLSRPTAEGNDMTQPQLKGINLTDGRQSRNKSKDLKDIPPVLLPSLPKGPPRKRTQKQDAEWQTDEKQGSLV